MYSFFIGVFLSLGVSFYLRCNIHRRRATIINQCSMAKQPNFSHRVWGFRMALLKPQHLKQKSRGDKVMRRTVLAILAIVTIGAVSVFAGGRIIDVKSSSGVQAIITYEVTSGKLWLAWSYEMNGRMIDYKPVAVKKGTRTKVVSLPMDPGSTGTLHISLWNKKVSSRKCAKQNGGTACQYCKKNKYHMEGRVDRYVQ